MAYRPQKSSPLSVLRIDRISYANGIRDGLARLCFVGIFIVENMYHFYYFETEIQKMVMPAIAPLPRECAVALHSLHIILGFCGACFIIVSGFDTGGRTALMKGSKMMMIFMLTITWTWWINRGGVPYWEMDEGPDKNNRKVHILKNIAIFGALNMMQQIAHYDAEITPCGPSALQGLITAFRPWSFSAVLSPALVTFTVIQPRLGYALPAYEVVWATLIGLICVQAVANLVNSYCDFKKGCDTKAKAGDRTLVDGLVSAKLCLLLAGLVGGIWGVIYIWSIVHSGFHPMTLSTAFVGTALALGYTAGPAPLKYLGLGDLTIFLCFGPLLSSYLCAVLIQVVPFEVLVFIIPVTLYTVAILHANNYRDIENDTAAGITTMATMLGQRLALLYYDLLLFGAHAVCVYIGFAMSCYGAFCTLWVLPLSIWLSWRIRQGLKMERTQDEETAKVQMLFGLSLAMGVAAMPQDQVLMEAVWASGLVVVVLKIFG